MAIETGAWRVHTPSLRRHILISKVYLFICFKNCVSKCAVTNAATASDVIAATPPLLLTGVLLAVLK